MMIAKSTKYFRNRILKKPNVNNRPDSESFLRFIKKLIKKRTFMQIKLNFKKL